MWWLLIVLVLLFGGLALGSLAGGRGVSVRWYEWLLAVVTVALVALALQSFTGSLHEMEPRAAWLFLASFGVPALILAVLTTVLVRQHNAKA